VPEQFCLVQSHVHPISGVNNQAFFGLFTLAMIRGTLNSNRASDATPGWFHPPGHGCHDVRLPDSGRFQTRSGSLHCLDHHVRRELVLKSCDQFGPLFNDTGLVTAGDEQIGQYLPTWLHPQ